jgi:hypothetical protein
MNPGDGVSSSFLDPGDGVKGSFFKKESHQYCVFLLEK